MMSQDVSSSLDLDGGPDFWSDVARPRAAEALAALDDHAWAALVAGCAAQAAPWRMRLTEALILLDDARSLALLEDLVGAAEPAVAAAAAEALIERGYVWSPDRSLRADLERHLANASPTEQAPLARLLRRLPT